VQSFQADRKQTLPLLSGVHSPNHFQQFNNERLARVTTLEHVDVQFHRVCFLLWLTTFLFLMFFNDLLPRVVTPRQASVQMHSMFKQLRFWQ